MYKVQIRSAIKKEAIDPTGAGAVKGPNRRSCHTKIWKITVYFLFELVEWMHVIPTISWNLTKKQHRDFFFKEYLKTKRSGNKTIPNTLFWRRKADGHLIMTLQSWEDWNLSWQWKWLHRRTPERYKMSLIMKVKVKLKTEASESWPLLPSFPQPSSPQHMQIALPPQPWQKLGEDELVGLQVGAIRYSEGWSAVLKAGIQGKSAHRTVRAFHTLQSEHQHQAHSL